MNITIGSYALINNHNYSGDIRMRIWYEGCIGSSFQNNLGGPVMCGTGSGNWYLDVICSLAGNILTIPSYILTSTDDSSNTAVTATAQFFVNGAPQEFFYKNFTIPSTLGSSISTEVLFTFNQKVTLTYAQNEFLTAPQVAAIVQQAIAALGDITHVNQNYAVHFVQGLTQNIDFGLFWPDNTIDLGKFFWEFWVKPDANSQYMISDGYGGAHAILFGFQAAMSGMDGMSGNTWNGSIAISFASDLGPQVGEWAIVALSYDGTWIHVYFNGVPVSSTAFTGPRKTLGAASGGGNLYIAGSDHQGFKGWMSQFRGWEGANPLTPFSDGATAIPKPYRPDTFLGAYMQLGDGTISSIRATILASMLRPSPHVPNLVGGEVGKLRTLSTGITAGLSDEWPLPQYEADITAPSYSALVAPTVPIVALPVIPSPPAGARVFDSFTRQNRTLAFGGLGGLGNTEAGSAGIKTWNIDTPFSLSFGPGNFGILAQLAVDLTGAPCIAWVTSVGTADMTVMVDRRPNNNAGINTGISFRVQDRNNFLYAYTSGISSSATTLHVGTIIASIQTDIGGTAAMPASWTTLKVVCSGNTITVFADATLVATRTISNFNTQQGAGLWNNVQLAGLPMKWKNFTVGP